MGNAMMRCGLHVVTDKALDEARGDLASMNKKCLHSYTRVLLYQLREMVLIEQRHRLDARKANEKARDANTVTRTTR
jgi:hypothetical protein